MSSANKVKKPKQKSESQKSKSTYIIDDIFTNSIDKINPKFEENIDAYIERLWESNPEIAKILKTSKDIESARDGIFTYLEKTERTMFYEYDDLHYHVLDKAMVRECIRVFKSIIGPSNEKRIKFSALKQLFFIAQNKINELEAPVTIAFIMEFINLFRGVSGQSTIYVNTDGSLNSTSESSDFLYLKGREAASARTEILDELVTTMNKYFKKFPSGLEQDVIEWRKQNKERILKYFKGTPEDWNNWEWQTKNVIKDSKPLLDLLELTKDQRDAIKKTEKTKIPFGITPYYLSLMDYHLDIGYDHAIRAQVIPPPSYVDIMSAYADKRSSQFDFMGEHDTSPVDLVTRRYPGIAIFKPFNTCAQICVYCQRNWEIDQVLDPKAMASNETIKKALSWFDQHKGIGEILLTGGDPLLMTDETLDLILTELSKKEQIYRIRIGTRTPVVLPQRWTDNTIKIINKFNEPGKRQITVVTHFEHSYEITPEAMEAVQKIRKAGLSVYNQQVYTIENSRRFESVKLRRDLKAIGIDPYYTFNMKGKSETRSYMVPIARLLQERKEEARLLPGLDRTDEPVFNVPKLGKNHIQSWQDHRVIMILANGSRVYEFHPWEKNIKKLSAYNYVDVPIYNYLEELAARGENIRNYKTIWFYY